MPVLDAAFELAALRGLRSRSHVPEDADDPGCGASAHGALDQVDELHGADRGGRGRDRSRAHGPVLAAASSTAAYVVADAEHLADLPQTPSISSRPEPRPVPHRRSGRATRREVAPSSATGDLGRLESWWDLPAGSPPASALVRVRRRHQRRFGSEA